MQDVGRLPNEKREQDDEGTDHVVDVEDHADTVQEVVEEKDDGPPAPALFLKDDEPQSLIVSHDICSYKSCEAGIALNGHIILTETR